MFCLHYLVSWGAGDRFGVGRWFDEAAQRSKGQSNRIVGLNEEPSEAVTRTVGCKSDSNFPSRLYSCLWNDYLGIVQHIEEIKFIPAVESQCKETEMSVGLVHAGKEIKL